MRGRSDDRVDIVIPLDSIGPPGAEADLVLAREGAGRLYYRVAMSYATLTPAPALARGFEITRAYEAVDDSSDVRRDENGTWRVRLGARVRVRLIVANAGPRYHVAVIDPLPAGLEAVNPMLAGNQGVRAPGILLPATGTRQRIDGPFHPEHVNVRAERFEAFSTLVPPGRREISYLALATTPGDFAAPAPRAEEMYATETFGRGAAARLIVEDR
jgi:uncharacterized protein YfaS (alpha-2-macroglobulin family)